MGDIMYVAISDHRIRNGVQVKCIESVEGVVIKV